MGQVALGFRSLLIKLAAFFVMAVLLAWALGGTLWPRAETADFDSVSLGSHEWFWRLAVGGREPGAVQWRLMHRTVGAEEALPIDDRTWVEVAGPVTTADAVFFAGRSSFNPEEHWRLERIPFPPDDPGAPAAKPVVLPDRLAVERQLARAKAGLPIQNAAAVRLDRDIVLDPALRAAGGGS